MKIYYITKFNLIGATLYTHELAAEFDEAPYIERKHFLINKVIGKVNGEEVTIKPEPRYFTLSTKPEGYPITDKYLPYIATVTEDLPGSCKGLKAKVYLNCKLMTEKHGGYLQFWHPPTKQVLRIAMNSHTYTPTN